MEPERIKIFVLVKKNLALIGFGENNSAFDRSQLFRGFLGTVAPILGFIYLFHVASTAKEYIESIIMTMAGVIILLAFISMNIQFDNIFFFIHEFEEAINESKYIDMD